mmetsp:Transcript_518/g.1601  ORF Transcript_518/g.1601 Transcript_518/m.1601 type:complete len:192 (+) Transcript_518:97-672(+)
MMMMTMMISGTRPARARAPTARASRARKASDVVVVRATTHRATTHGAVGWATATALAACALFGARDAALAAVEFGDDITKSGEIAQVAERTRSRMAGKYADRKHPGCYREIFDDGRVRGEDGDPGCGEFSRAGGAARPWSLSGTIDVNDGSIFIDFSPKGGPKNLLGLYVNDDGSEGVSFPDGNTWVKIDK